MNSLTMTNLILFPMALLVSFTRTESLALPGCPGECGNLSIPFPFGVASNCYLDDSFLIICNISFNPPKPFLQQGHAEVLNISLDGKIKILNSSSELMELEKRGNESVPVIIEWAARNMTCHEARNNKSLYACQSQHSKCTDSSSGSGHICHCLPGYEGNPYLLDGCQDIDECVALKPCEHVCINLPGSFKCYCQEGLIGDGRKAGSGCHAKDQVAWSASIFFLGILVLPPALAGTWILWSHQKKKLLKLRRYIFEQNGGNLLMKKMSTLKEPAMKNITVYTAEDMRKYTNNYRNKMEYKCRQGTCYLGRLVGSDYTETEVVIMQIPSVPKPPINEFIDQLIFLSKPHKNLVKIIGCCLETEPPFLVYEFHRERASLFNHVYDEDPVLHLSFEQRVKAAIGAATALAYLHSQHSRSIVHGNVSSANILLDDSNDTKLFYAVASNMITPTILSSEQEGYVHRPRKLFISGQLNEKNDVYSFGWVLTELLTGWKTTACPQNNIEQQVKEKIAVLAAKCLSEEPAKRPTMKAIKDELNKLMQPR